MYQQNHDVYYITQIRTTPLHMLQFVPRCASSLITHSQQHRTSSNDERGKKNMKSRLTLCSSVDSIKRRSILIVIREIIRTNTTIEERMVNSYCCFGIWRG